MTLTQQLHPYVCAGFSGIWLVTSEPDEAEREIAANPDWTVKVWDMGRGLRHLVRKGDKAAWESCGAKGDPTAPLAAVPGDTEHTLVLLHNYHRYLSNPVALQGLFNAVLAGKSDGLHFLVLSPGTAIPAELEKVFAIVRHQLPDLDALGKIAASLDPQGAPDPRALEAALGLTRYEAEAAFSLSIAWHGLIQPQEVWELKASSLTKSGLLELHRGGETLDQLGGLAGMKDFHKRILRPAAKIKPRGTLLLSPPGCGKSHFAKALGASTGRPVLRLRSEAIKTSLYGESEQKIAQALDVADRMAPCVLFVDEVEKMFAGINRAGDPGATASVFGVFLQWLQDHTSDVFVILTSNDITQLPPEFCRAERFDSIFFLDLPTAAEKADIWLLYSQHYGVSGKWAQDDGWTGAEIKACCRLAALLDVPLIQAARHIVPVSVTAAEKIDALRQWAAGRCLDAATGEVYGRTVTQQESPCNSETSSPATGTRRSRAKASPSASAAHARPA
ncbi:MAG: AAA family ATPase [Patescibacteria group bacterium]|nr:AAA family ATPase [Patescibacteria group bacterium]